jgi:xanthine/uracil/vitamin C permease (AzgA family)
MANTSEGIQVLSQGVGYGIVVGIGAFFALFMSVLNEFSRVISNSSCFQAHSDLSSKPIHLLLDTSS